MADDERAIRELVKDGLSSHGYRVITASNGEEAVRLFRQHQDITLLFTDSSMPVMDGASLISEIRKIRPNLPVILASGQRHIENGHSHRGVLLLSKPFSLDEMLAAVHHFLLSNQQGKPTDCP